MNYASLNKNDIANGLGVRVTLFVSGCRNRCDGCFNRDAWDFDYGKKYTPAVKSEILSALNPNYISGLTILGGEPFESENLLEVTELCKTVKAIYPKKTIWVYTGLLYDDVKDKEIMRHIDVLVDGPFLIKEMDLTLRFKGSRNQRIIDVQKSAESGTVKLYFE